MIIRDRFDSLLEMGLSGVAEQEYTGYMGNPSLMLMAEIEEVAYRKSEHRRELSSQIDNRSEGSIEYKHQHMSAVLWQKVHRQKLQYVLDYCSNKQLEDILSENQV